VSTVELVARIEAATVPGPGPARFALVLRPAQDPVAVRARVADALAAAGAVVEPLSSLEPRVLVVELAARDLADPAAAFAAAYALQQEFALAAAEPDLPTGFSPVPAPPPPGELREEGVEAFPPGCWAPEEAGLEPRWALAAMRVPEAWDHSAARQRPTQGAGVVVAQPDTGITRHAELAGVLSVGGYDVLDDDPDPTDPLSPPAPLGTPGHGTGTASVVVSPRSLTVWGSAPAARHMPIRAIESVVRITQVTVARAIDRAVADGAQVITMSLGGLPSFALFGALRRAVAADVIVLAAAGNCVRTVVWPARYDDCIAVAGTDVRDAPWRGTCRGAAVDVAAPAENVLHAQAGPGPGDPLDRVGQGQGTSYAVALTAGVAALWLAHHGRANLVAAARSGGETLQQMFLRLVRATARRPATWDAFEMGAGIVDAAALLGADLDLGRDREAVTPPGDPRERAARSVRSLVAEVAGVDAARDAELDWYAFGPEIAHAVLSRATTPTDGLTPEAVRVPAPVSPTLSAAVTSPPLRNLLGLDGLP